MERPAATGVRAEGEQFRYRHDRRDDFTFTRTEAANGDGHTVEASGTVHDPDSTINWRRDTAIGERRDDAVRKMSRGTGDDAGHLIKAEWGADPEGVEAPGRSPEAVRSLPANERWNLGLQNRDMNRGTYRGLEDRVSKEATANGSTDVTVRARTSGRWFDGGREMSRSVEMRRDGRRDRVRVGWNGALSAIRSAWSRAHNAEQARRRVA
ncbi:MAG: hypothetical protein ABIP94_05215 [Planctomycetota bacterium]